MSALNIQMKIDEYDKDRTYLLTKLNKYIKETTKIIDEKNIDNVLRNINSSKVEFGKSFIKYDDIKGDIILCLHKKNDKFREEYYKYNLKVEDSPKVLFHIVKIKY